MNLKKLFGAAGAVITGLGALVLAGKSGFGENLGRREEFDPGDFDDGEDPAPAEGTDTQSDSEENKTEE